MATRRCLEHRLPAPALPAVPRRTRVSKCHPIGCFEGSGRAFGAPDRSQHAASRVVSRIASSSASSPAPDASGSSVPGDSGSKVWTALAVCIAAAAAGCLCFPSIRASLLQAASHNLGFVEGLTLIFMSELGDKTFFIAALLSMRLGKMVSFLGSVFSLGLMTVISVAIGVAFSKVPQVIHTSTPWMEYLGAALLVWFGVRSLIAGLKAEDGKGDELADAEEEMEQAEKSGKIQGGSSNSLVAFWEVASLIFIAEWGDRSMLATIALATTNSPFGVAAGATLGHALATVIAVVGGAICSKYISEKMVNLVGGVLFLVFAAATILGFPL